MKEAVVVCICNKSFCSIHIVTLYHTTTNNCNTLRSIKAFRIFSFPSLSFFRLITTTVSPYPVSFKITQLAALAHFLAHTIFSLTINFLSHNLPRVPITNYSRLVWLTYPNWLSLYYRLNGKQNYFRNLLIWLANSLFKIFLESQWKIMHGIMWYKISGNCFQFQRTSKYRTSY